MRLTCWHWCCVCSTNMAFKRNAYSVLCILDLGNLSDFWSLYRQLWRKACHPRPRIPSFSFGLFTVHTKEYRRGCCLVAGSELRLALVLATFPWLVSLTWACSVLSDCVLHVRLGFVVSNVFVLVFFGLTCITSCELWRYVVRHCACVKQIWLESENPEIVNGCEF